MTTNKSDTAPPTWASIEASLSTLSAEDREALRRLTAPARHAWRVEQTIAAAAAVPGHPCRAMQAALIALDLTTAGWIEAHGCGVLDSPWAQGCAGLPVVSASVIFAALHLFAVGVACTEGPVEDATVAQQARGYALHRMAERVARGEPVVDPEGTTWADVVRVAREFLDAATGRPGSP